MSRSRHVAHLLPALVLTVGLAACTAPGSSPNGGGTTSAAPSNDQGFPDVVAVNPATLSPSTTSVAVTVSSLYDSESRYADAVRVRSTDGATVYGTLELAHDHATEQPFTRILTGLAIPSGVTMVVVEGHDRANGGGVAGCVRDVGGHWRCWVPRLGVAG